MRKIQERVLEVGLNWIRGLRGQEQDMSSLALEWEPFSSYIHTYTGVLKFESLGANLLVPKYKLVPPLQT